MIFVILDVLNPFSTDAVFNLIDLWGCIPTVGLSRWLSGKDAPANAGNTGDLGLILGWEDPLE